MQNRFSVSPQGIDGELFMKIASALAERQRPALSSLEFSIRQGIVTLRGKVPTAFDRNLAIATVSLVPGVLEVTDEVQVMQAESSKPKQNPRGGKS